MIRAAMLALFAATPLAAQQLAECDWKTSARNIPEPWEENTRTFAQGAVRVTLIDTLEPAAAAFHLMILSPPFNELEDRQCRLLSYADGAGYAGMGFEQMTAKYVPGRGLVLRLPVSVFQAETGGMYPELLDIAINQSTGSIQTHSEPRSE